MVKRDSKATKTATDSGRQTVNLKLPVDQTDGFMGRRIDMRLSTRQAVAHRRVFDGLRAEHAMLRDGQHIDAPPDTVRWILDQIYYEIYGNADPFSIVK